ncbi:hypothetical protein M405DRAFT_831362 [Rhizopogon salebrosus TDB-379]|nr:hypothetical protein M405DRAFT_831362 [Rhizopogon salebrosus TDB-379]
MDENTLQWEIPEDILATACDVDPSHKNRKNTKSFLDVRGFLITIRCFLQHF